MEKCISSDQKASRHRQLPSACSLFKRWLGNLIIKDFQFIMLIRANMFSQPGLQERNPVKKLKYKSMMKIVLCPGEISTWHI